MTAKATLREAALGLMAVACLAAGRPARGAPIAAERAKAAKHWETGLKAHQVEDWATAVAEWSQAYALDPKAQYLWGLARDEHRVGLLDAAKAHYLRFVALPDAEVPGDLRPKLAELRAEAAQHLASIELALRAKEREGLVRGETEQPGQETESPATTEPPAATSTIGAAEATISAQDQPGARAQTVAGWALVGLAGGATLAGIICTVLAKESNDEVIRYATPPTPDLNAGYHAKYNAAKEAQDLREGVAGVAYVVGGAAIVAGVVLLVLDAAADPGPGDEATAHWAPYLGPTGAGVRVGVAW